MSHSQSLVGGFKDEFYGKITILNGKSTINGSCSTINGYFFKMFYLYGMSSGTHWRSPSFFKMVIAPPTRCDVSISVPGIKIRSSKMPRVSLSAWEICPFRTLVVRDSVMGLVEDTQLGDRTIRSRVTEWFSLGDRLVAHEHEDSDLWLGFHCPTSIHIT